MPSGTQGPTGKKEGHWQSWDASHPAMPGPCSGEGGSQGEEHEREAGRADIQWS